MIKNTFICHACNQEKDSSNFSPSSIKKKDYRCRDCAKLYMAEYKKKHPERVKMWVRNRMRRWRERHPELNKLRSAEQWEKHKDKRNAYSREYSKNNRKIRRAQLKAYLAVKNGELSPRPCEVCGSIHTEKHHDDYSKPLEVRWLCAKHHHRHHKWVKDILT